MLNFTRKTYLLYFQETEHDIETFFAIKQCSRPENTKIYKELERLHEKNKFYSYRREKQTGRIATPYQPGVGTTKTVTVS